jgi:uncharacterized protein involved in type VI secretion and phage assembly
MSELDLLGLLQGRINVIPSELDATAQTIAGVTLGVVADVKDPADLGRVRLTFPWLSDEVPSAWARIAQPWAGPGRGTYLLPEVNDKALVAFQHGDLRFPFVLGFLWSENARPPEKSPTLNRRSLVSRTGHTLRFFDDAEGGGQLTVRSAGGHELTLDDKSGRIGLKASGGKVTLTIDAQSGSVTIRADEHDIDLSAPKGMVSITGANIQVQATGELKLGGQQRVRINC